MLIEKVHSSQFTAQFRMKLLGVAGKKFVNSASWIVSLTVDCALWDCALLKLNFYCFKFFELVYI